jgi:hypothetical protein
MREEIKGRVEKVLRVGQRRDKRDGREGIKEREEKGQRGGERRD